MSCNIHFAVLRADVDNVNPFFSVIGPYGRGGVPMAAHKCFQNTSSARIIQSNVNETNA